MLTVGYYPRWDGKPFPGLMNSDSGMVIDFRTGNWWMVPGTWED